LNDDTADAYYELKSFATDIARTNAAVCGVFREWQYVSFCLFRYLLEVGQRATAIKGGDSAVNWLDVPRRNSAASLAVE
jgi:hypothetical protein